MLALVEDKRLFEPFQNKQLVATLKVDMPYCEPDCVCPGPPSEALLEDPGTINGSAVQPEKRAARSTGRSGGESSVARFLCHEHAIQTQQRHRQGSGLRPLAEKMRPTVWRLGRGVAGPGVYKPVGGKKSRTISTPCVRRDLCRTPRFNGRNAGGLFQRLL